MKFIIAATSIAAELLTPAPSGTLLSSAKLIPPIAGFFKSKSLR